MIAHDLIKTETKQLILNIKKENILYGWVGKFTHTHTQTERANSEIETRGGESEMGTSKKANRQYGCNEF